MKPRGFALTELIVVVTIVSLLLALATLDFSYWQRKTQMERSTKELYTDLQDIRMRAAFTKIPHRAVFAAQQVTFQQNLDGVWTQTSPGIKNFPLTLNRAAEWVADSNVVEFDTRGVVNNPITMVVCLGLNSSVDASYDAVIITGALTNMGKIINRGGLCASTNVEQQ